MMPAAEINRLSLRGTEAGVRNAAREIEQASIAATHEGEWLIVRELRVAARCGQLEQAIESEYAEQARSAVWGGDRTARFANAVYFLSLVDMLTCRVIDAATERLADHWYWAAQSTSVDASRRLSVLQVLREADLRVPAVLWSLARRRLLANVLAVLEASDIESLLQAVTDSIGGFTTSRKSQENPGDEATLEHPPRSDPEQRELKLEVASILEGTGASATHVRLVVAMVLAERRPLVLRQKGPALAIHLAERWYREIQSAANDSTIESGPTAPVHPFALEPETPDRRKKSGSALRQPASAVTSTEETGAPGKQLVDATRPGLVPASEASPAPDDGPGGAPDALATMPPIETFTTGFAGAFALVNVMARVYTISPNFDFPDHSPWLLLGRYATEFGLLKTDPLALWLMHQAGYDTTDAWLAAPLVALEPFAAQAQSLYGDVLNADLLAMQATVRITPGDIEIVAAADQIKMPTRLAGLDQDPGWVPWLGWCIRFTYLYHS